MESDGASLKPMKVPNATEPVTPENAAVVVAVMGLDALGQPLETHVFRYQLAAVLLGVTPETPLPLEMAALMLTHPSGVAQYSPPAARIIPFLNKADRLPDPAPARALARRILSRRHPQIARVLIGQVQAAPPVIEVVTDV